MNEEELLTRIEDLESRLDALEQSKCEECDNDVCPDCGESPCVCNANTTDDTMPAESDDNVIDDADVEEVEELNFDIPRFDSVNIDDDDNTYDYSTDDEDDENSPYYG